MNYTYTPRGKFTQLRNVSALVSGMDIIEVYYSHKNTIRVILATGEYTISDTNRTHLRLLSYMRTHYRDNFELLNASDPGYCVKFFKGSSDYERHVLAIRNIVLEDDSGTDAYKHFINSLNTQNTAVYADLNTPLSIKRYEDTVKSIVIDTSNKFPIGIPFMDIPIRTPKIKEPSAVEVIVSKVKSIFDKKIQLKLPDGTLIEHFDL